MIRATARDREGPGGLYIVKLSTVEVIFKSNGFLLILPTRFHSLPFCLWRPSAGTKPFTWTVEDSHAMISSSHLAARLTVIVGI
jgi:hypothetical protein